MENKNRILSIGTVAKGIAIATGIITTIVAIGFVISVIYDWGFTQALGLKLINLPTTISDHFRTGLDWSPYLLVLVFLYSAIEFQFQRVERGLTEQEIIESSKNPEKTKKFRERPWKFIKWIFLLMFFSYILLGDSYLSPASWYLPIMLSFVWLYFAEWCYSSPLIKLRRNWVLQAAFTFLPIIFILAFFSGYKASVAAIREPKRVNITFSLPSPNLKGNLLREFERGVLIIIDSDNLTFIPWTRIKSINIEKKYKYKPFFRGILCERFHICTNTNFNKELRRRKNRAAD